MPLVVTLTTEKGLVAAVTEIAFMIISGGPLYFIFHLQVRGRDDVWALVRGLVSVWMGECMDG